MMLDNIKAMLGNIRVVMGNILVTSEMTVMFYLQVIANHSLKRHHEHYFCSPTVKQCDPQECCDL